MSLAGRPFEASGVWINVTGWLPIFKFSADDVLVTLRYVYPCSVYAYFMLSSITSVVFLHSLKASIYKKPDSFRTSWLIRFMHLCSFSYLTQLLAIFFHSFVAGKWLGRDDEVVSTAACMILYAIQSLCISDNQFPVWYPYYGSWSIGLICEPCMTLVWAYTSRPFELGSFYDLLTLALCSFRTLFYFSAIVVYMAKNQYKSSKAVLDEEQQPCLANEELATNAEQQPLLSNSASSSSDSGRSAAKNTLDRPMSSYGSTIQAGGTDSFVTGPQKDDDDQRDGNKSRGNDDTDNMDGDEDENPDPDQKSEQELQKKLLDEGNWLSYLKRYKVLLPYIWPMRNYKLQFFAVLVAICSLTDNVLNLLLPRQLGLIMDSLTRGVDSIVWSQLAIYALLRILGSDCGISFIREWLYFPIENYSKENLNRATFDHVLKLSADFHDSKSTSETMMAIRGGESFSTLIETVMLNGVGMIIDLFLAIIYLTSTFGPYEGLITTTTGTLYLFLSASLLIQSRQAERSYVMALYKEGKNLHDGIDGWQTVASFNQTRYERDRYSKSVLELIGHMKRYTFHWFGTRALQSLSLLVGLLAGCCLAIVRIKNGQATPGQFAMLLMYWNQLSVPLMNLSYISKHIGSMMIDAERVLDLLNTKITVTNQPGARPLRLTRGDVEFNGVSFGYSDKKNAVTGLSFFIHGGQSVAFVGVSGAGKSTILKLISRFYDPMEGSILIDNQNTKDVDIYSLRDHIGLVPQTPVLFNDTIMNNIRYARMSASDEEVYEACKAACIHDKIMGFPQQYETKVGERGVKLSGGELQRVAIARAILKRPDIVLLDEATSAVDTDTEQKIQASLKNLTENRTTFIVAHRLSTIMNADRIIVIDDGKILEMGDHESLLKVRGKYYSLWSKQVFLKPKKEEEEDKGKDVFVNDLSEDTVAVEQAKATSLLHAQVPKPEDGSIEDGASHMAGERQQGQVTASDIPTSVATNAGSRSTKSTIDTPMQRLSSTWESNLNPHAPSFLPQSLPQSPVSGLKHSGPSSLPTHVPVALVPFQSLHNGQFASFDSSPKFQFPSPNSLTLTPPFSTRDSPMTWGLRYRGREFLPQNSREESLSGGSGGGGSCNGGGDILATNKSTFYRPRYVPFVNSKSDPIRRASTLSSIPESHEEMDDYDEETSDNGSQCPAASGSITGHEDEEQDAVSDDEDCNSSDNQQLLSSTRLKAARWQEEYLKADSQKLHLPEHERGLSYWGRLFRQNADQARRRNEGRAQ